MGLVVNRPSGLRLGEFAQSQGWVCHETLQARPVFQGGPVELQRGWILHGNSEITESQELMSGLFLSAGNSTLEDLLREGKTPFRLLLGYAGWGAGQLEEEMKEGAWITVQARPNYVLDTPPTRTWNQILQDLGIDPATLALGTGLH